MFMAMYVVCEVKLVKTSLGFGFVLCFGWCY